MGLGRRFALTAALFVLAGCEKEPAPVDPAAHAEGLYLQATSLYLQGKFDEALEAYAKVEALSPRDPRLPAAKGEVLLSSGKLTAALAQFEEAARRDPRRSTNWSRVGFILGQLGRREEARTALNKAVELHPKDHVALEALGELDFRDGNLAAAVSGWRKAADVAPLPEAAGALYLRGARELVKANRAEEALELLAHAAARPAPTAEVLAEYGEQLVRSRRFDEAVQAFSHAAQRNPADPGLWELVGELHLSAGRKAEAIAAFEASLRVKERALPHVALARIHRARGDGQAAQRELERALQTASGEEAREAVELARLLVEFGRKQDALRIFETLSSEPDAARDVGLQVETAKLARELGADQTMAASCTRAKKADPKILRCP